MRHDKLISWIPTIRDEDTLTDVRVAMAALGLLGLGTKKRNRNEKSSARSPSYSFCNRQPDQTRLVEVRSEILAYRLHALVIRQRADVRA
jgi:hypothetical protein